MTIEILVPDLPESVADATVATWHKKVGETHQLKIAITIQRIKALLFVVY